MDGMDGWYGWMVWMDGMDMVWMVFFWTLHMDTQGVVYVTTNVLLFFLESMFEMLAKEYIEKHECY